MKKNKREKVSGFLVTLLVVTIMFANTVFGANYTKYGVRFVNNLTCNLVAKTTRTTKYSYIKVKTMSVYPDSGTDGYKFVGVRLTNEGMGMQISDWLTIEEGSGYQELKVRKGYLNMTNIAIQIRGCYGDSSGWADMGYNPL